MCSRNRIRSLTAEHLLQHRADCDVRSAGTQPDARVKVTAGLLGWADVVFVMESGHRERLRRRFGEALRGKPLVVLHIADVYAADQRELIDELLARLNPWLEGLAPTE